MNIRKIYMKKMMKAHERWGYTAYYISVLFSTFMYGYLISPKQNRAKMIKTGFISIVYTYVNGRLCQATAIIVTPN